MFLFIYFWQFPKENCMLPKGEMKILYSLCLSVSLCKWIGHEAKVTPADPAQRCCELLESWWCRNNWLAERWKSFSILVSTGQSLQLIPLPPCMPAKPHTPPLLSLKSRGILFQVYAHPQTWHSIHSMDQWMNEWMNKWCNLLATECWQ